MTTERKSAQFIDLFDQVQAATFQINHSNGWWDDRDAYLASGLPNAIPITVCALVGLIHTELSEAIEAVRKHPRETWADAGTKDTLVRELAGAVVRIMDISERFGLPLGRAIVAELEANAQRGFKHGGKAA